MRRNPPHGSVRRPEIRGTNTRGVFTSKTGRSVQFESEAEWALLLHLDRDPTVQEYRTWPHTFQVAHPDGQQRPQAYTPQCMVWRHDGGVEIHRIVRPEQWTPGGRVRGDELGPHLCRTRGWTYVPHRAEQLIDPTPFANLQALVRYRPRAYAQPAITPLIPQLIPADSVRPFDAVVADIAATLLLSPSNIHAALCHLIWHDVLWIDMNRLLLIHGAVAPYVMLRRLQNGATV